MPLATALADLSRERRITAEKRGDLEAAEMYGILERSYRNTVYCAARLVQEGGKLTGRYCSNRWCMICARVKTARAINRYSRVLENWRERWLVTLTAPNVATGLAQELRRYMADVVAIQRAMKRTHGIPLVAVRKLECTYNAERDDYHPHFHFLVRDEAAARLLLKLWLERRPDSSVRAQDVRLAEAGDILELFKYFTKLVTRTRGNHSARASVRVAQAEKLDVIFSAMRGLRVFQPVGFIVPKSRDEEDKIGDDGHTAAPDRTRSRAGDFPAAAFWEWSQESTDWFNLDTGEALAEYAPSSGMRALVESIGTATERGSAD